MRSALRLALPFLLVLSVATCSRKARKAPAPEPAAAESTVNENSGEKTGEPEAAPSAAAAVPLVPTSIALGAGPNVILSRAGAPLLEALSRDAVIDEVRDGGLTLLCGADRIEMAMRLDPEPSPPLAKGEQVHFSFTPLPARGQDVILRRGDGPTARTLEFIRMRTETPATRSLLGGEVQLAQVGQPHRAREGAGVTLNGLDVQVIAPGRKTVAKPGDVLPLALREGAADLVIASSLVRGHRAEPEVNSLPPFSLVIALVPSSRPSAVPSQPGAAATAADAPDDPAFIAPADRPRALPRGLNVTEPPGRSFTKAVR